MKFKRSKVHAARRNAPTNAAIEGEIRRADYLINFKYPWAHVDMAYRRLAAPFQADINKLTSRNFVTLRARLEVQFSLGVSELGIKS